MVRQNYPIKNEMNAKRIKWGNPQNYISWAYMKELRENNRTRKIYEMNPYVEVYQFRDNLYGLFTQNCDGAGDVWMYLIVGPEKALLIDTAFGLGDLKGLAEKLSGGKEVIVFNTHGHVDHAYGNCRFDRVYCHEFEVPSLEEQNGHMFDYLFDENGDNIWLQFDKEDLPKFKKYEIVGVPDGYVFCLGGDYEVEVCWLGGHVSGNAGILDRKNRIFFPGDDLCSDISGVGGGPKPGVKNGQYMNVQTFRDNLAKVVARLDEIDYVFPSHFIVNVESGVLESELEACDEILKDPDCYDYKAFSISPKGGAPTERYFKYIKGFSVLAYTMEGVYPPKEEGERGTEPK